MSLKTEAEVLAALKARFCAPTWALIPHVRNGTGYQRRTTRTADAVAMCLWPSRGLELNGFEVKVSRADWVKELAEPAKAEDICRFCDRWWLAVGDAEIVRPGELPPTWGLLVPKGAGLVVKVEAPKLEAQPVDRLFLAALLRKTVEVSADEQFLRDEVEKRISAEKESMRADFELQHGADVRGYAELKRRVAEFEAASGVVLECDWRMRGSATEIGAAVAMVLNDEHKRLRERLESLKGQAERIVEQIARELNPEKKRGAA